MLGSLDLDCEPQAGVGVLRVVATVPLDIAEGMYSRGKLRQARYHTALGPSREVLACLEVAVAMGYLKSEPSQLRRDLDRVIGTLVKLVG